MPSIGKIYTTNNIAAIILIVFKHRGDHLETSPRMRPERKVGGNASTLVLFFPCPHSSRQMAASRDTPARIPGLFLRSSHGPFCCGILAGGPIKQLHPPPSPLSTQERPVDARHLCNMPSETLHRVRAPLQWDYVDGRQPDGQVEMRPDANGVTVAMLLKQPRKPRRYHGVSFFLPTCDQHILCAAHKELGSDIHGCGLSMPLKPIPHKMQLVNDHNFTLRLSGPEVPRTVIGQHYTLFAATDMPVSDFEQHYDQLMQTFQKCSMAGAGAGGGEATLASLLDPHVMPADRRSAAAVMALEALAERSSGNTALFAALFALDMRSCDTDFDDVLEGCDNRAVLVAAALNQYVVRDPLLREEVWDAQEALAACLPGYKPQWCKYTPYWVSVAC